MPIDIIDGSLLWDGRTSTPPPPPGPGPTDAGDGVALPGLPAGMLVATTTHYVRTNPAPADRPNPWVAILNWLRRIDETREWTADYLRAIELDDLEIIELSTLSRNRSH